MTETIDQPSETREFHTKDLLSITTRKLLNGWDALYDIINFVTGVSHFDHQLARAGEIVAPWLIEQHPWLADITAPDGIERDEVYDPWIAKLILEHGEHHPVTAMPPGQYQGRDPIEEAIELAPNARILSNIPQDGAR